MVEKRLDKTTDPLIQPVTTGDIMDAAVHRGNIKKDKKSKQHTSFNIRVDTSDSHRNYYDGMDPLAGLKKKYRHSLNS